MRVHHLRLLPVAALAGVLSLSACSQAQTESAADQAGAAASSAVNQAGSAASEAASRASDAATSAGAAAGDAASSAAAAAGDRVDLNTASRAEIEAALRENGVADPARWAAELDKLRPIEADKLGATLRQELSKLNVDAATLRGILTTVG